MSDNDVTSKKMTTVNIMHYLILTTLQPKNNPSTRYKMLLSFGHSLKKAFALVATTSSRSSLMHRGSALYSTSMGDIDAAKNLLFDVPVSNNGGRVRIILYVS